MGTKENIFFTKSGHFINVYDNLFSVDEQIHFCDFFHKSNFGINSKDLKYTNEFSNQIASNFSEQDVNNLGFYDTKGFKFLDKKYNFSKKNKKQIRINCSSPLEFNSYHTDGKGITLIYYVNFNWNFFWGGHTIFLNEELEEVEKIVNFKVGRVVVFDSAIPHSTTPISLVAKCWRMSFVIQYKEEFIT